VIGLNEELAARQAAGHPVRIGMIGAGQMGVDVVAQVRMMRGIDVVVIADIDKKRAKEAYRIGMLEGEVIGADSPKEADAAVADGKRVCTGDYRVVTDMKQVDVMLEATGVPEVGARAALRSSRAGQHLAMMNVETDVTVGPLLRWYAERKGVLYALAAGDEPAACKELYDFADSLGFTVVAAGEGKNNPLDRHATAADGKWASEAQRRGLKRSNMAPLNRLVSEVFTVAKRTLRPGDVLDAIGGSTFYSLIDTYEVAQKEKLLPVGLAKRAKLTRAVEQDQPITCEDVMLHEPSTILDLRRLQDAWMAGRTEEQKLVSLMDSIALDH
jgi:predicted homoserine dehydrogenase-like protein